MNSTKFKNHETIHKHYKSPHIMKSNINLHYEAKSHKHYEKSLKHYELF
jgi:hypothetical protein